MTLPERVEKLLKHAMALMHPCVYDELGKTGELDIAGELLRELRLLMPKGDPEKTVTDFFNRLKEVRRLVDSDVTAAYEGDPAATSRMEVVMSYPGLYAVTVHRLAHELYRLKVPILPRVLSEIAHSKTGIDIHPGATVGEYFFIDHGTGIVIGETTVIGDHVKLYQGVTLGAKSFELDENGNPVKNIKRHPNIGNHVVIYANATILGGDTVIGDHCVIGGNTWLTRSVEAGSVVTYREEEA